MRSILRPVAWSRIWRILLPAVFLLLAPAAAGDWLVTRDGERVETEGSWEVRGRMVVFTRPGGVLSSMRRDEVDLDASRAATEEANRPPAPPAEASPQEPVMRLTDRDVGRGDPGATGPEGLVERLRAAHRYQDVDLVLRLVNWQDTPEPIREFMRKEFEWMLGRSISEIELSEVPPDQSLEQLQDGVTYVPNVDVSHRMEIVMVPDSADERTNLNLYVGTFLGSTYVAAARPAGD